MKDLEVGRDDADVHFGRHGFSVPDEPGAHHDQVKFLTCVEINSPPIQALAINRGGHGSGVVWRDPSKVRQVNSPLF